MESISPFQDALGSTMGQSRQEPNLNDTLQFDNGRLATSKSEAIVITEEKTLPEE